MAHPARVRARVLLTRESGLSLVEMMVAAVLLVTGVLGTFALIDISNRNNSNSGTREGATNIAREILEASQGTPYTKIGSADWIKPRLATMSDGSGSVSSPNAYTNDTTVARRAMTYSVSVSWCSVDDSRDGHGVHDASIRWCADSPTTGVGDPQGEDFKRVSVRVGWTVNGKQEVLDQLATFSASGAAIGPSIGALSITSPTVSNPSAPVITATPSNGLVTFRGTSVGAADMRFSVNGAEQQSGSSSAGNGAWNFNWNISSLKDGVYTIGAVAIDALGTRGEPRTMQVTLNRGAPAPISNLAGGYNYVTVNGQKKLVLEGTWDANTEGNIIGYEVLRGTTVVCPTSLETSCADLNPNLSGASTYTVKTWYRDGAGTARNVATSFSVSPPAVASIPTTYHLTYDSANPTGTHTGTGCRSASGSGSMFDMRSTAPAFAVRQSTGWVSGCLPPFPAGISMSASSMTLSSEWSNTINSDCSNLPVYLYLNGTTLIGGTGVNGGGTMNKIPKNNTSWSNSKSWNLSARNFAEGDQLSLHTPASTFSSTCAGVSLRFNGADQVNLQLPLTGGTPNLAYPAAPTGLTAVANGDGSTSLTWNAPGGTPAPDFYRIYRDGRDITDRYDTAGDTGDATIVWTDSDTGGGAHSYYVTSASATLVESTMAGPVSP